VSFTNEPYPVEFPTQPTVALGSGSGFRCMGADLLEVITFARGEALAMASRVPLANRVGLFPRPFGGTP